MNQKKISFMKFRTTSSRLILSSAPDRARLAAADPGGRGREGASQEQHEAGAGLRPQARPDVSRDRHQSRQ